MRLLMRSPMQWGGPLWLVALSLGGLMGCVTTVTEVCAPVVTTIPVVLEPRALGRLADAPRDNAKRESIALGYLETAGCDSLYRQAIPGTSRHNLICSIEGSPQRGDSRPRIIVGAHHDKVAPGSGVADNWSGIVILAALAEYFATERLTSTLTMVAFGEEERGMVGAREYVQTLTGNDQQVSAMVNVDTIGIRDLVIDARSDSELQCIARGVAASLGSTVVSRGLREMSGDWEPFARHRIPILNFHSMQVMDLRHIHTSRDRPGIVDEQKLTAAYAVILNSIVAVDRSLVQSPGSDSFSEPSPNVSSKLLIHLSRSVPSAGSSLTPMKCSSSTSIAQRTSPLSRYMAKGSPTPIVTFSRLPL